jgi:hypothetical protein
MSLIILSLLACEYLKNTYGSGDIAEELLLGYVS